MAWDGTPRIVSMNGLRVETGNVTLVGQTGVSFDSMIEDITSVIVSYGPNAPANPTYNIYATWSGNTVTVYSSHAGHTDSVTVRVEGV